MDPYSSFFMAPRQESGAPVGCSHHCPSLLGQRQARASEEKEKGWEPGASSPFILCCVQNGTSVDTTWDSVDTLSQNSPEGVLGRPLVSTLLELVSTHCPSLARSIVSTPVRGSDEDPEESDGAGQA
ncbi:hypothetical protein Taro_006305 [Colocasia esculenta]|uniref:Uncharacterized protein n=1 Tax=Colocasia esculenta TaxID=4460 RepID=A0A843TSD1_COLES|nr:hypothetical protein [Colocasia esculenta]